MPKKNIPLPKNLVNKLIEWMGFEPTLPNGKLV